MGYYSDYRLQFDNQDTHVKVGVRNALLEISGYTGWYYEHDQLTLNEAKWYDHQMNMIALSTIFPDLKFELHVTGEDGQQWLVYALNGGLQVCDGEMVFPPCSLW